jgi:hypothetical protein
MQRLDGSTPTPPGPTVQPSRPHLVQRVAHEYVVRSLHSDVRPRADGHANISRCKRGRVVDAIAHHRDDAAQGLGAAGVRGGGRQGRGGGWGFQGP